jgi:hypothetical protein
MSKRWESSTREKQARRRAEEHSPKERMAFQERLRLLRLDEERGERCTLAQLNAILFPSGKRMPERR